MKTKILTIHIKPGWKKGAKITFPDMFPLAEALKRTTINIIMLDQRDLTIIVTDVITPEYKLVVSQEGMPLGKDPDSRGDLHVQFDVKFPTNLTSEQKTTL
ncbi:hypothetical protein R6Q57_028398 [Mikania cordata]